jgi:hypothetical protein
MPRILLGAEVDRSESDILIVLPAISLKTLRRYSYADLFYKELRSGMVHQYEATARVELEPMTKRKSSVSYLNYGSSRRIAFHFPWLVDTFRSVAENIDSDFDRLPLPPPSKWWIDGE